MRSIIFLCLLCAAANLHAAVVTIDFESLYNSGAGSNNANESHGDTYIEDGMQIRDVDGSYQLSTWNADVNGFTGSTAMFNNSREATTELTALGGGSFDLLSIDLAPLHISYNLEEPVPSLEDYVYVTFVANTGHTQTFEVGVTDANWVYEEILGEWVWYTDAAPPVSSFYFDQGFKDVTSVTWVQNDPGPHQFDNIVVSNVVPVPAAIWLFGSALAGLGWLRRKPNRLKTKTLIYKTRPSVGFFMTDVILVPPDSIDTSNATVITL